MTNSEDNNFSNKDLYQHLWEGRNFELSHFWHRSVFLTGIFVVLLAGYGKVIFAMYFPESGDADITAMHHFIAWGITLLCLVFSMLWIMMSKGSKYCYERYEYSLNAIFWDLKLFNNITEEIPCHGNLRYPDYEYSNSIFSTSAGEYSVSKVNIAIGIIGLFVFSLLNPLHFANFLKLKFNFLDSLQCALFAIAQIVVLFAFIFLFLKMFCKSGDTK